MPELNKANRQVCDVDIRILKNKKPFLFFDTANTTTAGLSGDSVYAMKKGTRAIAFHNPIEGTLSIEAQILPFKAYALLSDGVVDSVATIAKKETITCATSGELTIGSAVAGTVFVFPEGEYGNTAITGTYNGSNGKFTSSGNLVQGNRYEVGYLVTKTSGIKKVSFNSKKVPKDYFITMSTLDKDEEGTLTPFIITAYKASIQRNFELSFSSEGEPMSITITFDLLEDANGDVMDIIEDTSAASEFGLSTYDITVVKGSTAPDIQAYGVQGVLHAVPVYNKVHASVSGDNDTIIISVDADATTGTSNVTVSDDADNGGVIKVHVVDA